MNLRSWRKGQKLTLADVAQKLGFQGKNPSRTIQRYELGYSGVDVLMAERILIMTGGAVTHADMAAVRRGYLAETPKTRVLLANVMPTRQKPRVRIPAGGRAL